MPNLIMELQKYKIKDNLFIVVCLLHYFRFFNLKPYVELGAQLVVIDVLFCLYFFYCFIKVGKRWANERSMRYFNGIYLMAIFSIFIANFLSGQSLYYGLRGTAHTYLQFGFMYYLLYKRYDTERLIKIWLGFTLAYAVCLLMSYIQYPNHIFGFQTSVDNDYIDRSFETRGVFRFNMPGGDLVIFSLLYLIGSLRKIKGKTFILLGLIVLIFLRGVRSCIIASALMGMLTYLFSKRITFKRTLLVIVFPIAVYTVLMSVPFTENIIDSYLSLTESQYEANKSEDDIRIQNVYYFGMEFNDQNSVLSNIIGNGPIVAGPLSKKLYMASQVGFWLGDVEYMTWFIYFGIVGLLLVILWGISCLKAKIPKNYYSAKMMILYYFFVMTFGTTIMDSIPLVCIVCYIIYTNSSDYGRKALLKQRK